MRYGAVWSGDWYASRGAEKHSGKSSVWNERNSKRNPFPGGTSYCFGLPEKPFLYKQTGFSFVLPIPRGLNFRSRTAQRQVSRLIVQMLLLHLPGLPVVSKHKLTKYGDEFVQDSHLFPFSPVQISHVVPLIIHNQDAIIHLTDTSRICIKLYVTTGSFYHTYTNASRNVINWRIWPHFRLWFPQQKWYNIPQRQNL